MNTNTSIIQDQNGADEAPPDQGLPPPSENDRIEKKLGLAFSGGGFRASLFHLGVLKRLADLDWLRYVSVMSTVSGGSIVGGLYLLHLKFRLQRAIGPLCRNDYVSIVDDMEVDLRRAVQCNLRTRLLLNPLANLATVCLGRSLGRRMARLYTRVLYRPIIERLFPRQGGWARKGVPLAKVKVSRQGEQPAGDLEAYNATARDRIPKLVLNATCRNTGRPFRFTFAEVGGPQLGYIRFDEIDLVLTYKQLMQGVTQNAPAPPHSTETHEHIVQSESPATVPNVDHLRWWRWVKDLSEDATVDPGEGSGTTAPADSESPVVKYLAEHPRLSRMLWNADIAYLVDACSTRQSPCLLGSAYHLTPRGRRHGVEANADCCTADHQLRGSANPDHCGPSRPTPVRRRGNPPSTAENPVFQGLRPANGYGKRTPISLR